MDAPTRRHSKRSAVIVSGALIALNGAFFLLSDLYYQDSLESPDRSGDPGNVLMAIGTVRMAFGLMTIALSIGTYLASLAPRLVGHTVAALLGLASLVAGVASFSRGFPGVLSWTLIVLGLVLPTLSVLSWRRVRAAWAFAISTCGVFGIVTLFGAPKVRGVLELSLWHTLIIPGLFFIALVSLAMVHGDYRDQGAGVVSR
jgi:hypothetical protein